MKKSILKKYPVKMAETKVQSLTETAKRIVVPEIMVAGNERILVLNIYRPEDIAARRLEPAYRIFQSRTEYIMEDLLAGKWHTACWKNFHEKNENIRTWYANKWDLLALADDADGKIIKKMFGRRIPKSPFWAYHEYNENPLSLIRDVQEDILWKKYNKRRKRRREQIRAIMKGIKACDTRFLKWAEEEGLYWSRFIFYKYTGRKQLHGICTHCKNKVILNKDVPRHNKSGICPMCKSQITFIAMGRKPRYMVHRTRVSKLERIGRQVVYREFEIYKSYDSLEPEGWTFKCDEMVRTFFDESGNDTSYKQAGWYMRPDQWQNKMYLSNNRTMLYPDGLKEVLEGTIFEHCALDKYLARNLREMIYPADYLSAYLMCPPIEYFIKLGMYKMADEIMKWDTRRKQLLPGNSLKDILGIKSDRELQLARSNQVDLSDFKRIQRMLEAGIDLKNREFVTLLELYRYQNIIEDQNEILPLRKLCSYIARQVGKKGTSRGCRLDQDVTVYSEAEKQEHRVMLGLWYDYIHFCREVGYEIESMSVLCPGDLHQAHDRVYQEYEDMKDRKKAAEQKRRDRKLNIMLKAESVLLSGKIKNRKYELVVPHSAADIRREGRMLGHCVGSYTDRVLNGECQIYFIRKLGELKKPYYTAEWRDGKIVQCRGKRNCDYNKEIGSFLSSAQKKLKKIHDAAKAA